MANCPQNVLSFYFLSGRKTRDRLRAADFFQMNEKSDLSFTRDLIGGQLSISRIYPPYHN